MIIKALFESVERDDLSKQKYSEIILQILKKILPLDFFELEGDEQQVGYHQQSILQKCIPLVTHSVVDQFPHTLSFYALTKYRPNCFNFFSEMVSRWLTLGQKLSIVLVYKADFYFSHLVEETYTICEVMINLTNVKELNEIQHYFSIIKPEISLGLQSEFYAQRILELKGLMTDEKTIVIQRFIAFLIKKFPDHYDKDVFKEMHQLLITCRDDFKAARKARHLSRIISVQYLFRKSLREAVKKKAHRRHLILKAFKSTIQSPSSLKTVLCLLVGFNFLRDQENFGEKHLIKAIQYYIPAAIIVENSFFVSRFGGENIGIAYVEVEKKDESSFTNLEIRKLRRELPLNLKTRIEQRLHNVFMPRNEEEIMRNILTLANQIKYVRDIPQVLINFDEQAYAHLYFNVILARLIKPGTCSIADSFKHKNHLVEYLHDRTKIIGHVRKKYAKEVSVFRLKLPKEDFLRADHSIDLYKARQTVLKELTQTLGEIRDYNGGMISKQHELLSSIRQLLSDTKEYDELLLENFFYSLLPVVVRALLDPYVFKRLFIMLLEGIKEYKQEGYYLKFQLESYNNFVLIIVEDGMLKDQIQQAIQNIQIPSTELAHACTKNNGNFCLGYICCTSDSDKKEAFFQAITHTLKSWESAHLISKKET